MPNIKACEDLNFAQFYAAYETLLRKSREGKLTVDDFARTTVSITNPGGLGTSMSVPRLMPGQGTTFGLGATEFTTFLSPARPTGGWPSFSPTSWPRPAATRCA